jgi:hypothetical protein
MLNDDDLIGDYVTGMLLGKDHWEALQYVLEKRCNIIQYEKSYFVAKLQDIFDQLNAFLGRDLYGAFDFEFQSKNKLKLVFYRTYQEMKASETVDEQGWIRRTMGIDTGG